MVRPLLPLAACLALAAAQLSSSALKTHVDSLTLSKSFNPVKEAYWTGYPHHRRTPFALSPDGKSAYLAYLDASGTGVHIQKVNPSTFAADGAAVTVANGKEAGGLVAHNDGFALLTNEAVSGEADGKPIAVVYRYTGGKQTFRTLLGGDGIQTDNKLASPDINGDLVWSEKAKKYAAYIVVTAYSGSASGHFGDAIQYINPDGKVENIPGASSGWGCSHNTGIAFEEADEAPFASLCAEDQGAIWLNTQTQGMNNDGVKVSNELVQNGASNEPMGGMSGSYSSLARFIGADSYIFSWVSRGATNLKPNTWMGDGYTKSEKRTDNRNVAIALFSDKKTLVGEQATSQVGAKDGDSQINWVTSGKNDCSNAHAAAFDGSKALITWEEISSPVCPHVAMGCTGKFEGTKFQMVDSKGKKLGETISSNDVFVAGDMVTFPDGRICWPYVAMDWKLDGPVEGTPVSKMSFACMGGGSGAGAGSGSGSPSVKPSAPAASAPVASAPVASAPVASAPKVSSGYNVQPTAAPAKGTTSLAAVEKSAVPSVEVPVGAPRPTFVSPDPSVSDVLGGPKSSAAGAKPPVVKPSATPIKSEPTDYPTPTYTPAPVVPSPEYPAPPAETKAPANPAPENPAPENPAPEYPAPPSESDVPAYPMPEFPYFPLQPGGPKFPAYGAKPEGDCDEFGVPVAKKQKHKSTRRPKPTRHIPGAHSNVCSTHTVTNTVYVTATPTPLARRV